ncbi:APC family permease [Malacoplasma muris]|uniref:APC family permease n=1 Tax=Malacoplasma muris TaxID=2119 RepID=UPI00398E601E
MNRIEEQTNISSLEVKRESIKQNINKKKISFLSAIFIVIGSSIGSGIFFKASSILENVGGSFPLAIVSWLVSAIAVVAMGLSLVEITSGKNDNLSLIGWNKTFNNRFIYKMCKNFMFYLYLPLTFFFIPFYAILALQDSITGFGGANNFGTQNDWAIWMIICIVISLWFILTSGLSSRAGNIQNWIITSVKFFPLIIVIILGFVISGLEGPKVNIAPSSTNFKSFVALSPGIGMFMSFSAVFFAYDGFYYSAGLQSEMKEPKKTPLALVVGLIIVTIIYLIIAISMSIATNKGSFYDFQEFLIEKKVQWIFGVVNFLIFIGVLGIVNSFAMWSTRFTEDLIKLGELPFYYKYVNKLNPSRPIIGMLYVLVITVPIIIIFSIIGGLGYVENGLYNQNIGLRYIDILDNKNNLEAIISISAYDKFPNLGNTPTDSVGNYLFDNKNDFDNMVSILKSHSLKYNSMNKLISFADLMANWTAILAFAFIVFAIIGCLWNRKTNKINVVKSKLFIPSAIVSSLIVSIGLIVQIIAPFVDLILLVNFETIETSVLVGRIMTIIVLIVFALFMTIPTIFDHDSKFNKNKKILTT